MHTTAEPLWVSGRLAMLARPGSHAPAPPRRRTGCARATGALSPARMPYIIELTVPRQLTSDSALNIIIYIFFALLRGTYNMIFSENI